MQATPLTDYFKDTYVSYSGNRYMPSRQQCIKCITPATETLPTALFMVLLLLPGRRVGLHAYQWSFRIFDFSSVGQKTGILMTLVRETLISDDNNGTLMLIRRARGGINLSPRYINGIAFNLQLKAGKIIYSKTVPSDHIGLPLSGLGGGWL